MSPQQRGQTWHTVITALAAGITSLAAVLGGINYVMRATVTQVVSQELKPVEVSIRDIRDSVMIMRIDQHQMSQRLGDHILASRKGH